MTRANLTLAGLCTLAAALPLAAGPATGGKPRIAQLSATSGAVAIVRALDGAVDAARADGPRVIGGSVSTGDVVRTDAGASATLTFSDGTTLELGERTAVVVTELEAPANDGARAVQRTVRVLAGELLANVLPSASVATRLETPSGIVSIPEPAGDAGADPGATTVRIAVREEETR